MLRLVRSEVGKKKGIGVGAFLLALVTAGALAHVAVRMKGIEVAYELGREKRTAKELEEQRRRLNIEIGMLKDPVRVVGIARDKLGMGPPPAAAIIEMGTLRGSPNPPAMGHAEQSSSAPHARDIVRLGPAGKGAP